jgi:hypothetical protein
VVWAFSGGTITIYEDAGTAADFGNTATFVDGTPILVGEVALDRTMFTATLGNASGEVDWTGGTRIGEIPVPLRLDWNFFCAVNVNSALPGFDEQWDGKVEPAEPIANDDVSWGGLKLMHR